MLNSIVNQPHPEIEKIVQNLLKEDSDLDRHENRAFNREKLVRAVTIDISQPEGKVEYAFSRNISSAGMGLITLNQIPESCIAILSIEQLKKSPAKILSECRWCIPYGKDWFISGWQFRTVTT